MLEPTYTATEIAAMTAREADAIIHDPDTAEVDRQAVMDAFVPCAGCGSAVRPEHARQVDGEDYCRDCAHHVDR